MTLKTLSRLKWPQLVAAKMPHQNLNFQGMIVIILNIVSHSSYKHRGVTYIFISS
jgi:hypothetical protein